MSCSSLFPLLSEKPYSPLSSVYFREQPSVEVPGSMHSQGALQGVGEKKTIKYISDVGGYDREIAERFYYSTWFFVHGIAVQTANGYGEFDPEYVDTLLDDQFAAMKKYYGELSNGKHNG